MLKRYLSMHLTEPVYSARYNLTRLATVQVYIISFTLDLNTSLIGARTAILIPSIGQKYPTSEYGIDFEHRSI